MSFFHDKEPVELPQPRGAERDMLAKYNAVS